MPWSTKSACREQNALEFAERQEGLGELERMRLAAEAVKEAAKEEQFHLKQSLERATKRLNEDRGHAVDELVRALHLQVQHLGCLTTKGSGQKQATVGP